MSLTLLACLLVFPIISLGLAWPLAARLALGPTEKILASCAMSLLSVFLLAWGVYVCALPLAWLWALPLIALSGLGLGWRSLQATLRDPDVPALLISQLIVTAWCIGWLALVRSYSGGSWVADWFGHLQRTWFFLERWPRDILFNGFDALPSRPPLANVVMTGWLQVTQANFRHYQLFSTLMSSLVFLPTALLALRWRGNRSAIAVLAVLAMVNPLFVQNATYAWTKLPAAFFTLTAVYFFLRAHDAAAPHIYGILFATSLAAGLLTHYSVGPYAVILACAWVTLGWTRRDEMAWWRVTGCAVLAGTLVLATWFGWALVVYGWSGTFLTNSSIADQAPTPGAQLQIIGLNLRDTLVPHFFRNVDFGLLAQRSSSGWWRDWFFNLYQTNFLLSFGSVTWAAILAALAGGWRGASARSRWFWTALVATAIPLGVGVHGGRDAWGLTHICLQPIVLLGLAFLAARWSFLGRIWRLALVAGASLDFSLGIALQFGVQSFAFDRCIYRLHSTIDLVSGYSIPAQMNFAAKLQNNWVFLGDVFTAQVGLVIALLGILMGIALFRSVRSLAGFPPR